MTKEKSALFLEGVAASSNPASSCASILLGVHASAHGIRHSLKDFEGYIRPLPYILRNAGYATATIGSACVRSVRSLKDRQPLYDMSILPNSTNGEEITRKTIWHLERLQSPYFLHVNLHRSRDEDFTLENLINKIIGKSNALSIVTGLSGQFQGPPQRNLLDSLSVPIIVLQGSNTQRVNQINVLGCHVDITVIILRAAGIPLAGYLEGIDLLRKGVPRRRACIATVLPNKVALVTQSWKVVYDPENDVSHFFRKTIASSQQLLASTTPRWSSAQPSDIIEEKLIFQLLRWRARQISLAAILSRMPPKLNSAKVTSPKLNRNGKPRKARVVDITQRLLWDMRGSTSELELQDMIDSYDL